MLHNSMKLNSNGILHEVSFVSVGMVITGGWEQRNSTDKINEITRMYLHLQVQAFV